MKPTIDHTLRPKKRSGLRLKMGKLYFTLSRYCYWLIHQKELSLQQESSFLPYCHFEHRSLLLRKLKDVDMAYQYNKIINLKIATQQINGLVLPPGQTFSYWKAIGKPTKTKGYVDGMVLSGGSYYPGIGGGLCQLSNLLYWMALHSDLTVIERYRHSFDVFPDSNRIQPFGSGATCVYPYRDLMIRNDTDHTYQLMVNVGEEYLEGEIRCDSPILFRYEIVEKNHEMRGEYFGGFSRHNELYRKVYDQGNNLLEEQYITENHALMVYEPFLEEGQI